MKIAIVVSRYLPADLSGAEGIARLNAEQLAAAGHDVTVLTSYINATRSPQPLRPVERIQGVTVRRFATWRFNQFRLLQRTYVPPVQAEAPVPEAGAPLSQPGILARWAFRVVVRWLSWVFSPGLFWHLLGNRYDCVHVTAFPHTHIWIAARAASLAGMPVVVAPAYHVAVQSGMAWQLRILGEMAARFAVFTGREQVDLAAIGIPADKMVVIPPGLIPPDPAAVSGARFRAAHGLGDAPVVLFAGTKSFDKGFWHVVEAMKRVQRDRPQARLVSMGPALSEGERAQLREQLPQGVDLGFLHAEKWDAFAACDVFVMPSRCDSFGLVYAEAWLCGKPVIGARCGSVPWVIHEGQDGMLVDFGDVGALASAIEGLLADPVRRSAFGAAGRAHVLENYTVAVAARRLVELYGRLRRR